MEEFPINLEVCETFCNEKQVYPAMKYLVKDQGMSVNAAGKKVEDLTKGRVTQGRARQVWNTRTPKPKDAAQTCNSDKEEHTKPEVKERLDDFVKDIKEKGVSEDDLKAIVDTVADSVEKGETSARVLSKAKATFRNSAKSYGPPRKDRDSDIVKMVNSFHTFLNRLDRVRGAGSAKISKQDRQTMNREFKLIVPRTLPYFLWTLLHMGVDLENVLKEALNDYREEIEDAKNQQDIELSKSYLDDIAIPIVKTVPKQMKLFKHGSGWAKRNETPTSKRI